MDMTCGCFASQGAAGEDPIGSLTMLRDAGWLLLGIYVMIFDREPIGLAPLLNRIRPRAHGGER